MYIEKLTIDVKKLIKAGLSIEQYFLLECLHKDSTDLLVEYVENCGKISKSAIDSLIDQGYIQPIKDEITLGKLRLSSKGIIYFGSDKLDHERFWNELLETYPKKVKKSNGKYRRLHQNMDVTKKKYKDIVTSEELHKNILKCIKLYVKEKEDANEAEFVQMLPTWINEKNYQAYLDEALNSDELTKNEDNYDVI